MTKGLPPPKKKHPPKKPKLNSTKTLANSANKKSLKIENRPSKVTVFILQASLFGLVDSLAWQSLTEELDAWKALKFDEDFTLEAARPVPVCVFFFFFFLGGVLLYDCGVDCLCCL